MNKYLPICALAVGCALASATAAEFPLKFKTIEAKDVMQFPGGYGSYSQIKLKKPDGLMTEPAPKSKNPLYGRIGNPSTGFFFRMDESKGDGKGYDQLIIDLNQNGDLSDDPVVGIAKLPKDAKGMPIGANYPFFGPVELAASNSIAGGRPSYYAQAYIYISNLRNIPEQQRENMYLGQLRLRAAWYLETDVVLGDVKQKIGILDGNADFELGETAKPSISKDNEEDTQNWYFQPGDSILIDADHSGAFERDAFSREAVPFGSVVYFGPEPYKAALSKDNTSLLIEPWKDALAEVTLQPFGEQVASVLLARETKPEQWELIHVGVLKGRIKVPPGNYRLNECQIITTNGDEVFAAEGSLRAMRKPFSFAVNASNTLQCGAPLKIKATATKRTPQPYEESNLEAKDADKHSDSILSINSTVVGQGGEVYSTYAQGKELSGLKKKPTVAIADTEGKNINNGNMEFG